jgi:hypothetical protein
MSEPPPLPKWPAGREYISVKEMAEVLAQWHYEKNGEPHPRLTLDRCLQKDIRAYDYEDWMQSSAEERQARENDQGPQRRHDVRIAIDVTQILTLASQLRVPLRRPTADTLVFCKPDQNFVLDKEGFRKITGELLDPLGISGNSSDAPDSTDQSTVSGSEAAAEHAAAPAQAVATQQPEAERAQDGLAVPQKAPRRRRLYAPRLKEDLRTWADVPPPTVAGIDRATAWAYQNEAKYPGLPKRRDKLEPIIGRLLTEIDKERPSPLKGTKGH